MRIGAYLGGMTELLAQPIANYIEGKKGTIQTNAQVQNLIVDEGNVQGVELEDGSRFHAKHVILATDLGGAKKF